MPGTFERITDDKRGKRLIVSIEESEARRLLAETVRDVDKSIESLRNNPWAITRTPEGDIRYNPEKS